MKLIRTIGLLLLGFLLAEGVNYKINSWLYLALCVLTALILLCILALPFGLETGHEQIEANYLADKMRENKQRQKP